MAKEYYFTVFVNEAGKAEIDSSIEVNYGCGSVWDDEVEDWSHASDFFDEYESAYSKLAEILREN